MEELSDYQYDRIQMLGDGLISCINKSNETIKFKLQITNLTTNLSSYLEKSNGSVTLNRRETKIFRFQKNNGVNIKIEAKNIKPVPDLNNGDIGKCKIDQTIGGQIHEFIRIKAGLSIFKDFSSTSDTLYLTCGLNPRYSARLEITGVTELYVFQNDPSLRLL